MTAIPSERARAGVMCGTARPATVSVPASGRSAPVMILMSVDLPAPFSPTSAWTSPGRRSNDTPRSARTPSKDFEMPAAESRRSVMARDDIASSCGRQPGSAGGPAAFCIAKHPPGIGSRLARRFSDRMLVSVTTATTFLKNLWDDRAAAGLTSELDLLRYRSNLLGEDLRITNFGGGNMSSKFELPDPLTGKPSRVMAVKGSGGDLRSIGSSGFAILYLDKLEALIDRYRGEAHEDEMVGLYPLCAFGENRVAASIDTALHAFLPFPHVDHLHPDWAIALAASANGGEKLAEFNSKFGRRIAWVPWQRPGFELALMLKRA